MTVPMRVRIGLDWWPPDPGARIGEDRAHELVAALKATAGPVVDEAEADLRERTGPQGQCVRSGVPAGHLARMALCDEMTSLCVGTVYLVRAGDPQQNSIQLMRDGTLTWRREIRADARHDLSAVMQSGA